MRGFVYPLLASYWAFCIVLYGRLPGRIAVHFNMRGQADGWSDAPHLMWFALPLIITLTIGLLAGVGKLSAANPHLWNVPEKKRFLALTAEQRAPILQALMSILDLAAIYTIAVAWVVQWSIYANASKSHAIMPVSFHVVTWGGLVLLVAYAITMNRRIKDLILAA